MPAPSPALLHKLHAIEPQLLEPAAPLQGMPSPCINVCQLDASHQHCIGCLRTLEELRIWGSSDAATQRNIWLRIRARCQDCQR